MKKKSVLLPILVAMFAVGGAFASHNLILIEDVTKRPPIEQNECEDCEGDADTSCTTEETETPCECILATGAVQGLNDSCQELYRPNP